MKAQPVFAPIESAAVKAHAEESQHASINEEPEQPVAKAQPVDAPIESVAGTANAEGSHQASINEEPKQPVVKAQPVDAPSESAAGKATAEEKPDEAVAPDKPAAVRARAKESHQASSNEETEQPVVEAQPVETHNKTAALPLELEKGEATSDE